MWIYCGKITSKDYEQGCPTTIVEIDEGVHPNIGDDVPTADEKKQAIKLL